MIDSIPNIPFIITIFAEWCACVNYTFLLKRRFNTRITVLLCTAGIFCHYQILMIGYSIEINFHFLWYMRMAPVVFYMLLFIHLIIKVNWKNTVFLFCKAFLTAELMASGAWTLYCHYLVEEKAESMVVKSGILVLIFILILALTFLLERSDKDFFETQTVGLRQNIIAVLIVVFTFYLSNRNMSGWISASVENALQLYDIRIVFDVFGYTILYLLQKIFVENEMMSEMAIIKNTLNTQYKQYLNFRESSEYISRQCHDLKHQIAALRNQITEEEREEYFNRMEQTIEFYDSWIATGNSTLDTILTQKNIFCREHDITLNCTINGQHLDYLAVRDICSIFGNILDNAIEAVIKYPDTEKKVIHGEVYQKQSFLIIRFENYFEDELILKDQMPVTTKSDNTRHGYGVKSIKYTVEKYGGNISVKKEGDWFIIKIIIPISNE